MTARTTAGFVVSLLCLAVLGGERPAQAVASPALGSQPSCSLAAVEVSKARFESLSAQRRFNPGAVSMDAVRAASQAYITLAEACYDQLLGASPIDHGGLTVAGAGAGAYTLGGLKWGPGSPYISDWVDNDGPRIPAGAPVSFSFMADGPIMEDGETTTAIHDLPGYITAGSCFLTEIRSAFTPWAAVANIQFTEVADNGADWDQAGAAGEIRIGAHAFDGPSGELAHAYYPPPNGVTAAGDMHFDVDENWACTPGADTIDIGIVALHEVGHAIGLDHEFRYDAPSGPRVAVMNPFYNLSLGGLLGDDINGAENIYGSAIGNSPDAILDFGASFGVWVFNAGVGFTQIHALSPEQIVACDLDGNGIDDILSDFGAGIGVWKRMDTGAWSQVHVLSPTFMDAGDIDGSGRDDVVMNFPGAGLWTYMNNASFVQLHTLNTTLFAIGDVDDDFDFRDDVVLTFPGLGVWRWMNNTEWVRMHTLDASRILIGDFDDVPGFADDAKDIVLGFAGFGLYLYPNLGAPVALHGTVPQRLAAGDMNGDGRDEIVGDFGAGVGLYKFQLGSGWAPLGAPTSQEIRLGDLDGNGRMDLLADFGAPGLYVYLNNTTWLQVHPLSPEGIAIGDLN